MPYDEDIPSLDPYLGTSGPRYVTGGARGSPAGPPRQAREAPNLALTRERIQAELEDNPWLQRELDRNTTAELGAQATPEQRRWYQALTIDRAVSQGKPLAAIVNAPDYYPQVTRSSRATTGMGVDPSIWEGANPANYATGNSSWDPITGHWVGFQGGPQTSSYGRGITTELGGIEGPSGLQYARTMGYGGPSRTAIGPSGPGGMADAGPVAPSPSYTDPKLAYSVLGAASDNPADRAALGASSRGAETALSVQARAKAMLAAAESEQDQKDWENIFKRLRMPGGSIG